MKSCAVIGYQNGQAGAIFPVSRETFPHNESVIDQAFLVKMAGYWPRSFLCVCVFFFASLWTSTHLRS